MGKSSKLKVKSSKCNAAFLWDESFLWGLMAYKELKNLKLPFELIRSSDIKKGCLKNYEMLFVPGGWASKKSKSLGEKGIQAIRNFVRNGGNYLGLCGGAGLATQDGIGLLKVSRKPTKDRVPSFNGRIYLNLNEHLIWEGLLENSKIQNPKSKINSKLPTPHSALVFHAWWSSQFIIEDNSVKALATYGDALPDSFSSDLNVGDIEKNGNWLKLEKIYKINLDPKRLLNEPAVIEGIYGKGEVILSLIHFDTPNDASGAMVLKNLWEYLVPNSECGMKNAESKKSKIQNPDFKINSKLRTLYSDLEQLEDAVSDLISLGKRNFLWFWRNPILLHWRRGVRGLEYCTLYVMIKEIAEILKDHNASCVMHNKSKNDFSSLITDYASRIRKLLIPFTEKSRRLLLSER
ncbi:MAG: hypothetical protein HZC11_01000, partial [Nitrospirae bacterium]|nr:hypothetical protein [Nitrospirota bacterium]